MNRSWTTYYVCPCGYNLETERYIRPPVCPKCGASTSLWSHLTMRWNEERRETVYLAYVSEAVWWQPWTWFNSREEERVFPDDWPGWKARPKQTVPLPPKILPQETVEKTRALVRVTNSSTHHTRGRKAICMPETPTPYVITGKPLTEDELQHIRALLASWRQSINNPEATAPIEVHYVDVALLERMAATYLAPINVTVTQPFAGLHQQQVYCEHAITLEASRCHGQAGPGDRMPTEVVNPGEGEPDV